MRLDRPQRGVAIVDNQGRPTLARQVHEQRLIEQIEAALAALQEQLDLIQAAQDAADAADAAAAAANAAATAAQTAADNAADAAEDANANTALIGSYPSGVTMTGKDVGASATVDVSAHTRTYADGSPSVSVSAGSVTGLAYSTLYYVYYDQPSRAGGSVTYVATTSETTAAQTGARHLVGKVTTPAAAAPDTGGFYVRPPGVGDIP